MSETAIVSQANHPHARTSEGRSSDAASTSEKERKPRCCGCQTSLATPGICPN